MEEEEEKEEEEGGDDQTGTTSATNINIWRIFDLAKSAGELCNTDEYAKARA